VSDRLALFDLGRAWPGLREDALALLDRLGARGDFSLGEELAAFEGEWAAWCGTREAVGVANGTAALELALRAVGAGPGTEVVTVAHTFVATLEAIAATGATPVLVDVDPATRCLDPAALAGRLSARTAAVVPVHLYGRPAPMPEILAACAPLGIPVVEDAAQAHGATLAGRRAGALATAAGFSFYPTKNLGALGDAGAVTTDDPEVAALVRSLRHHGSAPGDANRHEHPDGGTERLDNLQAGFLRIKLRGLDAATAVRRAAAERYPALLAGLPLALPPPDAPGMESAWHLFVVEVEDREGVRAALDAAGIATGVHYPRPAHLQPGWRHLGLAPGDLPHSERLTARCLSLPLFPGIEEAEQERVAAALRTAVS
jgi:dTDP-4-amino-4,6-dideoxygalactose transaminase